MSRTFKFAHLHFFVLAISFKRSLALGVGLASGLHDAADPAGDEVEVEADGHDEDDGELDGLSVQPIREVHVGGCGFESQNFPSINETFFRTEAMLKNLSRRKSVNDFCFQRKSVVAKKQLVPKN